MGNACPVILVHGMVGWGPTEMIGFPYWGTATWVPSPLARHVADIGPISSLHDRACELAYQIRCGGTVDYGAQHANDAGHDRYGHQYTEALHPAWSEAQPVHLVGHSMGGPTAFLLQQLLAEDYFGWNSNERWIASISSISGVLNGSTATYYMGCDETTGYVNPHTAAMFLGYMVEMFLRATGGKFDRFYDFHLEQWRLPLTRGMNLAAYIANIAASAMFKGTDNGAYSLTIQNLLQQNARCRTYPKTYYFSPTQPIRANRDTCRHMPTRDPE